jgi:membrane protein implicated in regulation of membrane protease activity
MESVMLGVKFLMFFALEFTVVVIIGACLVAAVYQVVRDRVRESREEDQITREAGSTGTITNR